MNEKILVVDDERELADLLEVYLQNDGYTVYKYYNGRDALEGIEENTPDLAILDVMLPDMDGFTICRKVRELSQVPIIMLTAKDDIDDKVQGLDIGADDYITKPFATPELLARMRVVLRRQESQREANGVQEEILSVKNLTMYPARHEVQVDGTPVELTKKEYDLLEYLLRNKRNVLTRDQILSNVWDYDYMGDTNVVDVYIRYLRQKLDDRFQEKYIHTMRGVGYVIKD